MAVLDEVVTRYVYEADTKALDDASKRVKELDAESKKLAEHTNDLGDKQIKLKEKLQVAKESEQALRAEKAKVTAEIKKQGKATAEQERQLELLEIQLKGNAETQQKYNNELRKNSIEQAKATRAAKENARAQRELNKEINESKRATAKAQSDVFSGGAFDKRRAERKELAGAMGEDVAGLKRKSFFGRMGDKVGGAAGGLAGKLPSAAVVGAIGAAFAGAAVAAAGFAAAVATVVQTGSEMETLRARLKTVTGSTEGAAEAFGMLQQFSATTPFELQEVTTAYARLASLGLQPTRDMLESFGNIAAAQGKSVLEFAEAVADASTGEFERLKEFGIKASSQGEVVAFTFGGVTTKIKKDSREITAFLQTLGKEKFAGAMTNQMATFSGMLSNVKDAWTAFLDNIAQMGVLDEAKNMLSAIGSVMNDELARVIADLLVTYMKEMRELFVELSDDGMSVTDVLVALVNILKLVLMVTEPITAVLGVVIEIIITMISWVGELAGKLLGLKDAFIGLIDTIDELTGEWPMLAAAWENVSNLGLGLIDVINGQTEAMGAQVGALDTIIGKMKEIKGVGGMEKKTDAELQELVRAGDTEAEAEIKRRVAERQNSERADEGRRQFEGYLDRQKGQSEKVGKHLDRLSDQQLDAYIADPNISTKLHDKAVEEREKRAHKKKTAKGKKGKKEKDGTLSAEIEKQMEKNARELAQADTARALRAGKLKPGEMKAFETERYEQRLGKMQRDFETTGRLPAGIAMDVRQIAALPSINDLAGRTAPPVISVVNNKFEITGNDFTVEVTGQFATSPAEVGRLSLAEMSKGLAQLIGQAIPGLATSEVR